jgi:hypothetical protein
VVKIREKPSRAKAKELRTTNALEQEAKRVAEELMNSADLKVFRYVAKRKRTPHLYAETSNGTKFPLCGKPVDETVAASQIKTIRGDECAMCKRAAQGIFNREAN